MVESGCWTQCTQVVCCVLLWQIFCMCLMKGLLRIGFVAGVMSKSPLYVKGDTDSTVLVDQRIKHSCSMDKWTESWMSMQPRFEFSTTHPTYRTPSLVMNTYMLGVLYFTNTRPIIYLPSVQPHYNFSTTHFTYHIPDMDMSTTPL